MSPKNIPALSRLRRIGLLAVLSDERLNELEHRCAWRQAARDEEVVSRESRDRGVYLVVSGQVRVTTYSAGGRQVTFRDVGAGNWFGEVAAIDGLPRSANVQALEDSVLAIVPHETFMELLETEPAITREVLQRLAGLVRSLSERVLELSTLGVSQRLQAELLRLSHLAGVEHNRGACQDFCV